jgi:tRNA-splicing ligase RtcB
MGNSAPSVPLNRIHDYLWEVPKHGEMRVPGRIYADRSLLQDIARDQAVQQVVNVAHLPGIVGYSLAMPDIHWGYGFPIGGVAATDPKEDGVVSPGGVGYDINCGVRVARTDLIYADVKERIPGFVQRIYDTVPCGVGAEGGIGKVSRAELKSILKKGAAWAVERGYGLEEDLEHTEEGGTMPWADPDVVSQHALDRGHAQVGSLGSGNHFLELQIVEEIYLPGEAERMGLKQGTVAVMVHSGSRGLGHQVCTDSLREMGRAMAKYKIRLPDRQLAAAPIESDEGKAYLGAMFAAANFAWCNRQIMMHLAAKALADCTGTTREEMGFHLIYDVAHNIAKFEKHEIGGKERRVLVHRKGATRAAVPPESPLSELYREIGQPVLIPGDMGRYSFLCLGNERSMRETFGSTCHGAGRQMSRTEAKRRARGRDLLAELKSRGVAIRARGMATVAEEMPEAYKDVARVVEVMEKAGIARILARLKPVGVVKG